MSTNRPIKKLGEVSEIVTGTTPSKAHPEFWGGNTPFVKPPYLGTDNLVLKTEETLSDKGLVHAKPIPKNAIMVCCIGSLGKIGIAGKEVCTNQQINSIIFDEKIVDFKYGYYFCTTLEKIMKRIANQAVVQIINKSQFSQIEIPLPPLATQQFIVAKLDETFAQIDEAIATTQANIDQTDELTKSVLDKRFNEGDMKFVDLDYVCSLITDGTHATPKYIESGIPFLSVKNITHGIIDFSDTRFVSKEEHQQLTKRCNPEFGDILYTKVGTTGIAKIIDVKRDFSIFVSLALLKVKKNIISNEYLEKILNSPLIYQQSQEKTRGVANRNLVIKDIKSIQIPLPSLNKQQEIVSYLDHVFAQSSQLKEQYQKKLVELKELKASILQSAFEGKLV